MVNGELLQRVDLAHTRICDGPEDPSSLLHEMESRRSQRHNIVFPTTPTLYHAHNVDDLSSERSLSTASGKEKCHICKKILPMESTSLIQCSGCQRRYHMGCHKHVVTSCDSSWRCYLCSAKKTGIANGTYLSNSPTNSLDYRFAKRRRVESSHHSPRVAFSEQQSSSRLHSISAEPVKAHSTQPLTHSQTSLDTAQQLSHPVSIEPPLPLKSVAEVIRETKQPEFVVMSLYDEYPEYRPDAHLSSRAHDMAGRARPSRKQMFGKQCPSARLKDIKLGMQRYREPSTQRDRAEEILGRAAPGQQRTNEEEGSVVYDSIESLLGLPESVVPTIHEGQLHFAESTQMTNGGRH